MRVFVFCILLCFGSFNSIAQFQIKQKKFAVSDTIIIDSLSLLKESVQVFISKGSLVSDTMYNLSYEYSTLVFNCKPDSDSVLIKYKTLPIKIAGIFARYDRSKLIAFDPMINNPFILTPVKNNQQLIDFSGFEKSGSIARGLGVGNNQSLVVNSGFNLQIAGKLAPDVELSAAVTDNTIPFQPDGYTQQIRDFDRVFVQVKHPKHILSVGDFDLTKPDGFFLNYFKNVKGLKADNLLYQSKVKKQTIQQTISLNAARGKFGRNSFVGVEGNQGPYRLVGEPGEAFIVVLAASERVYIDGELLKRGEEYDYVMDYNTAEVRFMPKRMITNQARIIIEFEYANQAYLRLLTTYQLNYASEKVQLYLNSYRDADVKNQPFQQSLSDEQIKFLQQLGNNVEQSFFPGAQPALPENNTLLYRQIDTLGFARVFIFDPRQAAANLFRVNFSFVGQGNGNYRIARDVANGRVYEFVQPLINGSDTIKRGDYVPLIRIAPPQILGMTTAGVVFKPSIKTDIAAEIASSYNTLNAFALVDNQNDRGQAMRIQTKQQWEIKKDTLKRFDVFLNGGYEFLAKNFRTIQPYRNMEFARDWDLQKIFSNEEEHLVNAGVELREKKNNLIGFNAQSLRIPTLNYFGNKYGFKFGYDFKKLLFSGNASSLQINQKERGGAFNKVKLDFQMPFFSAQLNLGFEQERNLQRFKASDSLSLNSFDFHIINASVGKQTSSDFRWDIKYNRREDRLPLGLDFRWQQTGHTFTFSQEISKTSNNIFRSNVSIRRLYVNQALVTGAPEQSLIGNLDYSFKWFKQFVVANLFYQIGNGQELRRDFSFLEVAPGQGAYTWIDYNNDGIQQLNEFERAFFSDQARYIKIFIPSNTYVQTFNTQFSQTIQLQPERIIANKTRLQQFITKWSTLSAFTIDKKTQSNQPTAYLNPFELNLTDSSLQATNAQMRNSLFWNRNNPKYGIDINNNNSIGRILLSNGFETRTSNEWQIKSRLNLKKSLTVELVATSGMRTLAADYFEQRNFNIQLNEIEPRLNWVLSQRIRLSFAVNMHKKFNLIERKIDTLLDNQFGEELLLGQRYTFDINYNLQKESYVKANLSFAQLDFDGNVQNSAAFEMLQGLLPGVNGLWSIGFFKKLANNMQINITYDGRKSGDAPIVHVGRVQARVTF